MSSLLLHTCCAPCATGCIEHWRGQGMEPTLFWYNPNIHAYAEHQRRLQTLQEWAKKAGLPLIVHSLRCARLSPVVTRCIVSTDSEAIAGVVRAHGGDVPSANCVATIERNLKKVNGVQSAVVNLCSERATVEFDPTLDGLSDLVGRVERAGYGIASGEADLLIKRLADDNDARRLEKALLPWKV